MSDNNGAPAGDAVQLIYGHVIPKDDMTVMPCLSITTRRFWDEQHRIPGMGEWERRYFPEELAAVEHVVDALQLDEIMEGVYKFRADTPAGKAREEQALALWKERKYDELSALHEEIVALDLKPAIEELGAVESPRDQRAFTGGLFLPVKKLVFGDYSTMSSASSNAHEE